MRLLYFLRHVWTGKLSKTTALFAIILFASQAQAQMKLGDNPNTINASALLELESTNKGLLLPRMTNGQMQAITTPAPGMAVYVTDSACIYVYRTGGWHNMCVVTSLTDAEIIRIIAENAHNQPLIDSIYHAVLLRSGSLTSPSGMITVGGGSQVLLKNATVDVNTDSIINLITRNGKNVIGANPISIIGGIGAALQAVTITIDSNRLVPRGGTPGQILIKDSSGSSVWGIAAGDNWGSQVIFHNTTLAGNGTSASPIGVDTFGLATILSTSPSRDTILSIVSGSGKNLTAGSTLVTVTGGTGATLQTASVDINRDTVISAVSTSTVLHDTVNGIINAHARDITAASTLITVTGGAGASLQNVSLDVNRDTIVHAVVTNQVLSDTVNNLITARGRNLTAASGLVTITGGTGATLTNATVDINRDTVISTVINSPIIHDSIIKIVADNSNKSPLRDSIFSTVVAQGKDITAIAPMTVTGGTGASLRPVSVSIDSNRIIPTGGTPGQVLIRDSFGGTTFTTFSTGDNWGTQVVAHNGTLAGNGTAANPLRIDTAGLAVLLPTSPISDTIVNIVSSHGKNLTSTQPALVIANGLGTTLKNTSLTLDSLELIRLLLRSHLADSLMNFKGFNVAGNSTANSFLNLNVTIGSSSDLPADYSLQNLPTTTTYPNFNDFGVITAPSSTTTFTAPVDGYYAFDYAVTLVVNPSLLSVGGSFVWGIAVVKTNGTPTVLQSTRTTQTLAAGALGLGVATVGSNTLHTLVKLAAGDKVSVGVGSTSGITVGLVSSTSTVQHFSGYWVK